jgi:lysophospholipase L1-like esterase
MRRSIRTVLASLFLSLSCFAADGTAPPEPISRIAFLGDSITAGVGVKTPKTDRYSTVATRLLQQRYPGITEINLGRSGQALCQQKPDYAEAEVLSQNPDAVVIQWGVNDQYWGYSVTEFTAKYEDLVSALRRAKPKMPIVLTTPVADFRWPENQDAWIGQAAVAIQEIAARHRCHLADTHHALDHRKAFYADAIHPNNAGAEAMARSIAEALSAEPLSPENARIRFDQGAEVRFLQNVFLPEREGIDPRWILVSEISQTGMLVDATIPMTIRTAPLYAKGDYRIEVRSKTGAVIETLNTTAAWSRMLIFKFTPKGGEGPFRIEISAAPETGVAPAN